MNLTTKFNIGDTVWALVSYDYRIVGPLTIGRLSKEITDSPGRDGEQIFDNYKPQRGESEKYMCVETGIGSGSLYSVNDLFDSREKAVAEIAIRRQKVNG